MNKDKVIKDLKERNDKLKNQYQLQEIRLHSLEYENEKLHKELDYENNYNIYLIAKLDKIKEEIDNLGALDCNIPNYMICITKINELLEEINE